MSSSFDPYHKWLGISPADQPANHYRLLGISNFENDPDVIEAGADQRMLMLRSHQSGKHATHSQKLLNEISKAKIVLLDPQRRAAYDAELRTAVAVKSKAQAPAPRQRTAPQQVAAAPVATVPSHPPVSLDPLPPMTQDAFANAPAFYPQPVQPQATPQPVWTGAPRRRRKSMFTSAMMLIIGAVTGILFLGAVIVVAAVFAMTYERESATGVAMGSPVSPFSSKKAEERSTADRIPVFEREKEDAKPKPVVPPSPVEGAATETRRVDIPANKRDGYSVGALAKGQSIQLQYVTGKWKAWGRLADIRPDKTDGRGGDKCRVAIVDFARGETVLALCPEGTQSNPFTFTALDDIRNLVLRINDDDGDWRNPGAVTYDVTVPAGTRSISPPQSPAGPQPGGIQAAFLVDSTETASLKPGLVMQEYAALPNQSNSKGPDYMAFVEQKGTPQVIGSVGNWQYDQLHNAVASGFLKIDQPGEYQFNSNNFYDRNALWIGGRKICGFRDGEGNIVKVQLPAGYIHFTSVGYVAARGSVRVKWIPPGGNALSPLPDNLLFHLPGETTGDSGNTPAAPVESKLADLRPISKVESRLLEIGDPAKPLDWKQIPAELSGGVARIYDQKYNKYMGRVEFEITEPGMIYAIGHFKDQGSRGTWNKERWLPKDFLANGWTELKEKLIRQDGVEYTVYGKHHQPSKDFRLRVNKYHIPLIICRAASN